MSEVKIKLIKCINIVKLVDEIDMNTRLFNSLFDSFDFVMFISELERTFQINIGNDEVSKEIFLSVATVIDFLEKKKKMDQK